MARRWKVDVCYFINRLEGIMVKIVVLGILSLIISQTLLTNEYGRNLLSQTDRIEGSTIQSLHSLEKNFKLPPPELGVNNANWQKTGFISLRLLDNTQDGKVKVLLNGAEVAQFTDEMLTIRVREKDLVQIDTAECSSNVALQIVATSDNLITPRKNTKITSNGNIIQVGRIKIKDNF